MEKIAAYECPNGHLYFIGNCSKPNQVARCECKETIGGEEHILDSKNKEIIMKDKTKTGYCLMSESKTADYADVENIRAMNLATTLILRCFINCSLIISCKINRFSQINPIMTNGRRFENSESLLSFFETELDRNLNKLTKLINRSYDDTVLTIHFYINMLFKSDLKLHDDSLLSTTDSRLNFENIFGRIINENVINYEEINNRIHDNTIQNSSQSTKHLFDIISESIIELPKNNNDNDWYFKESRLWFQHVEVKSLVQIKNILNADQFESLNLLNTFLTKLIYFDR